MQSLIFERGDDWGNKLEVRPDRPTEPSNQRDIPERDDQNFPPGSGKVVPDHFDWPSKTAATIDDILSNTGGDVRQRAQTVQWKLSRADQKRGIWTFQVKGSKESYKVRIKGLSQSTAKSLSVLQVKVSCTCNFFRWQGPEHWAKANSYLYGKPVGTASRPDIKDPKGKHWACKHIIACLMASRKYRRASCGWGQGTLVEPEWLSASRVAGRWLGVW